MPECLNAFEAKSTLHGWIPPSFPASPGLILHNPQGSRRAGRHASMQEENLYDHEFVRSVMSNLWFFGVLFFRVRDH